MGALIFEINIGVGTDFRTHGAGAGPLRELQGGSPLKFQ